jgi:glycine betaine/proline transport system permease protein
MIPLLMLVAWVVSRQLQLVALVAVCFGFLGFVDYYSL